MALRRTTRIFSQPRKLNGTSEKKKEEKNVYEDLRSSCIGDETWGKFERSGARCIEGQRVFPYFSFRLSFRAVRSPIARSWSLPEDLSARGKALGWESVRIHVEQQRERTIEYRTRSFDWRTHNGPLFGPLLPREESSSSAEHPPCGHLRLRPVARGETVTVIGQRSHLIKT